MNDFTACYTAFESVAIIFMVYSTFKELQSQQRHI